MDDLSTTVLRRGRSSARAPRGELPGLTGLRAIAVVAVVAYHLGYLRGGFVGVDVFFVLSGFLITTLLIDRTPSDTASMLSWWGHRIRRLTPAAALVVLAVLVAFATTSGVALDGIATLTWWQNWHLIAEGSSYWSPTPSPLRHAWSLSIEEQFYLVWPPVTVAVLHLARRARRPLLVLGSFAGSLAVASFLWAAWLAVRTDDLSRIYFGTDTRGGALLLGCAAAAFLAETNRPRMTPTVFKIAPRWVGVVAPVGATALVVLALTMTPEDRWAYTGGLAVAAVGSLAVVVGSTTTKRLDPLWRNKAMRWVGTRSYAIYLWSWPLQMFFEQRTPQIGRLGTTLLTLATTAVFAEVSLRVVEGPLRVGNSWARRLPARRAAWSIGLLAVLCAIGFAMGSAQPTVAETVAEEFERMPDPVATTIDEDLPATSAPTTTCVGPPPVSAPEFRLDADEFDASTVEEAVDPTGTVRCGEIQRVLVVGDSTARGAANGLRRLGSANLEVWDRSELGCGFVVGVADCSDWDLVWADAIATIDPDTVVVVTRPSEDVGIDGAFMDPETAAARRGEFDRAVTLLSSKGARVFWALPADPANGFYCDGKVIDSPCDPVWLDRWRADVAEVASARGVGLLDVQTWVVDRGRLPEDRPDGLHLSGRALDEQAAWIAQQLRQP